jgi:hypothetical protein
MIDKIRSISMLVLSLAGLIVALAALVFVLRSNDARADAGASPRYQLTYDAGDKTFYVLDTTTAHIWYKSGGISGGGEWFPLSDQLNPTKKR